jgi:hypothetical protein
LGAVARAPVARLEMLSVGRELKIKDNGVVCRQCAWEGEGAELSTGLVKVTASSIYRYVYRCPACAGFDLARKGKLLQFRLPTPIAPERENRNALIRSRS